jgi:predicted enzyme related to lactoylglutathione lyase
VGEFSWHELATTDLLAGFKFYSALFGWENTGQFDLGPAGIYHLFGLRGVALGGMHRVRAEQATRPAWLPYVRVDDVKIAADRTLTQGGVLVTAPEEVPGGDWIAVGKDPQGGTFAVHQLKA